MRAETGAVAEAAVAAPLAAVREAAADAAALHPRGSGQVGTRAPPRALAGPPRDQVLGLSMLAGNGTLVRLGGRVVKNVAGFDLAKAVIGAHGGFGAITALARSKDRKSTRLN